MGQPLTDDQRMSAAVVVRQALERVPHDLVLRGMGTQIDHADQRDCVRCNAERALHMLEMDEVIQ